MSSPRHLVIAGSLCAVLTLIGWTLRLSPGLTAWDSAAGSALHAAIPNQFYSPANLIAVLCGAAGGPLLSAALVATIWLTRRNIRDAVDVGSVIFMGSFLCLLLKALVQRPAPIPSDDYGFLATSFPSGHTAFAASISVALLVLFEGTHLEKRVLALGIGATGLVAASRVFLGVHYPLDTVAGVVVAVAAVHLRMAFIPRVPQRVPGAA